MKDLHLTTLLSTAGALRNAISQKLLTGEALGFDEYPGIGPLDDGKKRIQYLRGLIFDNGMGNLYSYRSDAFEIWRQLQQRLRDCPVDRVVIWAGGDGNDYVFVRMVCWWLKAAAVALWVVQPPPHYGNYSLYVYNDRELAPYITQARQLDTATRDELAAEYERIVARPELLRECDENGQLLFLDLSTHDNEILEYCHPTRWRSAVRIVGQTMGLSHPRNPVNEVLASGRIKALVEAGKLKARGNITSMRAFEVKRSGA
ncbi:uncharacterized protein DUF1835 [Chitinophaga polysaccharea]|uniref:Uncharacterized protein DUF1835 n=1 Tax=Chitinophaga polysaccharea TaxID=1293035 RepID=A0A561PQQ3_9BACT|nr:DUF3658 domain-containing protein [Chitinophaga polysaccharea]TWF40438.1 uncharacterized protein DUF1835 [Chitinophaga polysaccharea]